MDLDQTTPRLFVYEASNLLLDGKNIHFVIMR